MSLLLSLIVLVGGAVCSLFFEDMRRAAVSVWVAGLGAGAVEMALGAEVLAVTQWILSSVALVVFILFSVTFGEYRSRSTEEVTTAPQGKPALESRAWRLARAFGPVLLGGAFMGVVFYGYLPLERRAASTMKVSLLGSFPGGDIRAVAQALLRENFVSLQIVALILLLVVVGAGVVSRPEGGKRVLPDASTRELGGADS
jgi:NADH:ubiquinone oxidoreductase subunit 6 (subunit J)